MVASFPRRVCTGKTSTRLSGTTAWLALALTVAPLGGCYEFGDLTGSIATTREGEPKELPTNEASLRAYADHLSEIYDQNPGEKVASINYARALRALARYKEAAAVMQAAAVKSPTDFEVLGAYGKALTDAGQYVQAKDVLTRAYPADRPDWRILSVQGAVEDYLGDHVGAQSFYHEALEIAPGEPTILNNQGLSYALTKQPALAEGVLREAAASPRADARVRQNLALVLSLDGKFAEAERVDRRDISKQAAATNVRAIRAMFARAETLPVGEPVTEYASDPVGTTRESQEHAMQAVDTAPATAASEPSRRLRPATRGSPSIAAGEPEKTIQQATREWLATTPSEPVKPVERAARGSPRATAGEPSKRDMRETPPSPTTTGEPEEQAKQAEHEASSPAPRGTRKTATNAAPDSVPSASTGGSVKSVEPDARDPPSPTNGEPKKPVTKNAPGLTPEIVFDPAG
jgi:Flp pilus assembly protein TadD